MQLDFNDVYELLSPIFNRLSAMLNLRINGTSLIVILVTLFLVSLILRFILGAPSAGVSGSIKFGSLSDKFDNNHKKTKNRRGK